MNPETILKLVLLLGVVLLVVAIGVRARLQEPLLLLRKPALALRAMLATREELAGHYRLSDLPGMALNSRPAISSLCHQHSQQKTEPRP